jgi:hypothetical protein
MLISTQLTYKTITITQKGTILTIIMVDYTIITPKSNSVNNFEKFLYNLFIFFCNLFHVDILFLTMKKPCNNARFKILNWVHE